MPSPKIMARTGAALSRGVSGARSMMRSSGAVGRTAPRSTGGSVSFPPPNAANAASRRRRPPQRSTGMRSQGELFDARSFSRRSSGVQQSLFDTSRLGPSGQQRLFDPSSVGSAPRRSSQIPGQRSLLDNNMRPTRDALPAPAARSTASSSSGRRGGRFGGRLAAGGLGVGAGVAFGRGGSGSPTGGGGNTSLYGPPTNQGQFY